VFQTGIKTTETNRTFSKQTEKISKNALYKSVLETINFFGFELKQNETQSVSVFFGVCGSPNNVVSVCFGVLDRYRNKRNKQNLWYGELKRLYLNKFAAVSVGLLFVSVVSKH
jgi:hypothetical protein